MNSSRIIFYFYLFFYFVYNLQGILYTSGNLLSQVSVLILIVLGLFAFQFALRQRITPSICNLWSTFLLITIFVFIVSDKVVYGTLHEAIGKISVLGQYKGILVFLLTIYVSYNYGKQHKISNNSIFIISVAFVLLALMRYALNYYIMMEKMSIKEFTNNAGYNLVNSLALLPLMMREKKKITTGVFVLLAFLIMTASKRGAILCMLAAFIFSIYYYSHQHNLSIKKILIICFVIIGFGFTIYYNYTSNSYLQHRIERMENKGIGTRTIAYKMLWEHWVNDDHILTKLFGNGTAQTVSVWGNYAHNDWLEILTNYGLLGVITYMLIFLSLWKYLLNSKLGFWEKWCAYLCLLIWFMKTYFSMGFTDIANAYLVFYLGLFLGINEKQKYSEEKQITNN